MEIGGYACFEKANDVIRKKFGLHFYEMLLETLNSTMVASLVIVLEGFKEISGRLCPLPFSHVHLPPTLMDDPHDSWMWDR